MLYARTQCLPTMNKSDDWQQTVAKTLLFNLCNEAHSRYK